MDTILPSAGIYKVNANVNGFPLDGCSFVGAKDKIQLFFEEPVSDDPDVTGLMVFLKDPDGEVASWKVIYNLDKDYNPVQIFEIENNFFNNASNESVQINPDEDANEDEIENVDDNKNEDGNEYEDDNEYEDNDEYSGEISDENENENEDESEIVSEDADEDIFTANKDGDELNITVNNLDKILPVFPFPKDLPMGKYTIVSQVLSGKQILQKIEKSFFYLADANFAFEGVQVNLPGIAENSQIPRGTVVMLEAKLNFDSRLDPYVVWYDGRKIISEGNFSEGAGNLFWIAPEQSGFFPLRVETFPIANRQGLAGYPKNISLLVSSKSVDMHLIAEDTPELMHWYVFGGDLKDSKMKSLSELALKPSANKKPMWMPANGTYGLVSGTDDVFTLPKVSFSSKNEVNRWKVLLRCKPLNDGVIFAVQFGASSVVTMNLSKKESALVLTLTSSSKSVSQVFALPEPKSFFTAEINFSVLPDKLSAKLGVIGAPVEQGEKAAEPISLEVELDKEYRIMLGSAKDTKSAENESDKKTVQKPVFTALWDEFALFFAPLMPPPPADEKIEAVAEEELLEREEQLESDDNSYFEN